MINLPQENHSKKSKLEEFKLGFEYNRTLSAERRITKRRSDASSTL